MRLDGRKDIQSEKLATVGQFYALFPLYRSYEGRKMNTHTHTHTYTHARIVEIIESLKIGHRSSVKKVLKISQN